MKKYLPVIERSALFRGVEQREIEAMLGCLSAVKAGYDRGQFILRVGDEVTSVGMVLSGRACIIKEDFWGNRNIMAKATPGEIFAEAYACSPSEALGVSVVAEERTEVMFLDVRKILTSCTNACDFHTRLIRNLLTALAERNLLLSGKLTHMMQRTTREKLLSYLSSEALAQNSTSFEIPFNRQQLADYLSVDRSAMSNELCKMRDEGLLSFSKNSFALHAVN